MDQLQKKYNHLKEILHSYGSAAIAYSSGVDSTFLLKTAQDVLGNDRILAVTASSCSFPVRELVEAKEFCAKHGIRQEIVISEELEIEGFRQNPKNRCYLCKHELFEKIRAIAAEHGMAEVAEGSNMDDNGDYRPGMQAISELGIRSPLREAGLYKSEIRELSRQMDLPTWDKQSFACLASRFVYGETISEEKLGMVDRAEQFLLDRGFRQVRVRMHGRLARIEVLPEELPRMAERGLREELYARFKEIGFDYVTMDLLGYRTGSMNETI